MFSSRQKWLFVSARSPSLREFGHQWKRLPNFVGLKRRAVVGEIFFIEHGGAEGRQR